MHTALDIAKLNAATDGAGLIEANKNVAPELTLFPGFSVSGLSYTSLRRVSVPEGGFTKLGAGSVPGKSQFDNAEFFCYNYKNPLLETVDRARANRKGEAAFLSMALSGAIRGAILKLGRTLYYGARAFGGGADAHPGLIDLYDADNMTVDAGGTADDTCSSVWLVKVGNMEDGNVSYVFGNNQGLTNADWLRMLAAPNPEEPTKITQCWGNEVTASPGISLADPTCVVRIKKLTNENGKGMNDSLGQFALEKFPTGVIPDFALMTKRTRRQLQQSRATPENKRPPLPTDIEGIPIIVTDSLSNTEKIAL